MPVPEGVAHKGRDSGQLSDTLRRTEAEETISSLGGCAADGSGRRMVRWRRWFCGIVGDGIVHGSQRVERHRVSGSSNHEFRSMKICKTCNIRRSVSHSCFCGKKQKEVGLVVTNKWMHISTIVSQLEVVKIPLICDRIYNSSLSSMKCGTSGALRFR